MQKGKHRRLLEMVLGHLAESGPQFAEFTHGEISSAYPGKPSYENKCTFPDGQYIAVLQDPRESKNGNTVNTLAFGYGSLGPRKYAEPLGCWDPDDDMLKAYARDTITWVRDCLTRNSRP